MKPPPPITDTPRENGIPVTVRDQPPPTGLPINKTRADFRVEEFIRTIKQKGYFFTWRKAMICPRRSPESAQPRFGCNLCNDSGYLYVDPIEVQGIMTGLSRDKLSFSNFGAFIEGVAQITVEPEFRPSFLDSYQMKNSVMVHNEWIEKGSRRGFRQGLPDRVDAARYQIVNVIRAITYSGSNLIELREREHFNVEDGMIRWTSVGAGIANGSVISLSYEYHPVWLVVNHPHSIRDTLVRGKTQNHKVTALPVLAAVQLDYTYTAQRSGEQDVRDFLPVEGGISKIGK